MSTRVGGLFQKASEILRENLSKQALKFGTSCQAEELKAQADNEPEKAMLEGIEADLEET